MKPVTSANRLENKKGFRQREGRGRGGAKTVPVEVIIGTCVAGDFLPLPSLPSLWIAPSYGRSENCTARGKVAGVALPIDADNKWITPR